jgi:hypothetical protein
LAALAALAAGAPWCRPEAWALPVGALVLASPAAVDVAWQKFGGWRGSPAVRLATGIMLGAAIVAAVHGGKLLLLTAIGTGD